MNRSQRFQIYKSNNNDQWDFDIDSVKQSVNSNTNSLRYQLNSDMIQDDQSQFNQFIKKKQEEQNIEGQRQFKLVNQNISSKNSKISVQKAQKVHQKLVVMVMVSYLMDKRRQKKIKQWTANPMKGNLNKKKQYEKYFFNSLQQSLQSLKWNRIQNIPVEKRNYYLGKQDILSIQLKNHLKNMIEEQTEQFDHKSKARQVYNQQKYQQFIKTIQQYVIVQNQSIQSDRFKQTIHKINQIQTKQNKKLMLQHSIFKNLQISRSINTKASQKISSAIEDKINIYKVNHLNIIDINRKIIPHDQDSLQFISLKNLFKMINSLKKLKSINDDEEEKQQNKNQEENLDNILEKEKLNQTWSDPVIQ